MGTDSVRPCCNDHLELGKQVRSGPKLWLFCLLSWWCHTPSLWASLCPFVRWCWKTHFGGLREEPREITMESTRQAPASAVHAQWTKCWRRNYQALQPQPVFGLGLSNENLRVQRTSRAQLQEASHWTALCTLIYWVWDSAAFLLSWAYFSNEKKCRI